MNNISNPHLSDFFAWIEACPELSRRENDELTQRIAKFIDENRDHPRLWFMAAAFRTVGDAEFVEDALMPDPATWPAREDNSSFSASFMCGRIWREFDVPHTADNAYGSCFVLCHLWGEHEWIESSHREEGDWGALLCYPGWGDDVAPDVLADLGACDAQHVSRSARQALNRVLGRPINAARTQEAALAAVKRIAASAPPHLALNGVGVEFALRRYEECRGWDDTEEGAEA